MAILDLQKMQGPSSGTRAANSGASKGCNNHSSLSLVICPS